jgi:Holliday junction DNA helicase RuvB
MAIISSKKQPSEPERSNSELEDIPLPVSVAESRQHRRQAGTELVRPESEPEENGKPEERLRPQKLSDYVGQKDLKDVLDIAIRAAKVRGEPLDHLLLYGPPGLGKTTMSLILASEMGVNCKITSAPSLERPRDIMGLLVTLQPGDVLFIDEIHRLPEPNRSSWLPSL